MINLLLINSLALNISLIHDYQLNVFDCTQYAQLLNLELRKLNYNSYCVFGKLKTGDTWESYSLHNWVVIRDTQKRKDTFIETTQGNLIGVIDSNYYKQNYYELRRGKCQ